MTPELDGTETATRVFYYPAFVRIEAADQAAADYLADYYFGDVNPGSAAWREGAEDGLIVTDAIRVFSLGPAEEEDE